MLFPCIVILLKGRGPASLKYVYSTCEEEVNSYGTEKQILQKYTDLQKGKSKCEDTTRQKKFFPNAEGTYKTRNNRWEKVYIDAKKKHTGRWGVKHDVCRAA